MSSERLALEQVLAKLGEVGNNIDRYFSDYPYALMETLRSFVEFFQESRTKEAVWEHYKDKLLSDLENYEEGQIHFRADEYYDALKGEVAGYRVGFLAIGFTEAEFATWEAEARGRVIAREEQRKREHEEREAAFLRIPPQRRILNEIDEKRKTGEKHLPDKGDLACVETLDRVATFLEEDRTVEEVLDHFREEYYDILDRCVLYSFSPYGKEEYGEVVFGKRWGFDTAFRILRLKNGRIEQMCDRAKERVRPQLEEMVRREKENQHKLTKEEFIQALRDFAEKLPSKVSEFVGAEEGWLGYIANNSVNEGFYLYLREDGLPTWSTCNIKEINHDTGMPFGSDWLAHSIFEWSIGR